MEGLSRIPVNHTSWIIIVIPSDRPKSVRNRYVIELFGDVFVLSCCPFDISVGIRAFVIGLSQISSFFFFNSSSYVGPNLPCNELFDDGFFSCILGWYTGCCRRIEQDLFVFSCSRLPF